MDLDQLRLLLDVVREGSFAQVARARRRTPSWVSRGIASLEDELGLRLLHRTTRRLSLTEAGERYVDRVGPLVEGLQDAARLARDTSGVAEGVVRATVPVSFGIRCVGPLLAPLRQAHPGIELDLLFTDRRVDLLTERVDFAIRLGRLDDPELVARRLFPTHYRVVASPGWIAAHGPLESPDDLRGVDALVFPLPSEGPVWRFRSPAGDQEITMQAGLRATNMLVLRDAARAGLGVTVLPHWLADRPIASGELVRLLGDYEVTLSTFGASAWIVLPTRRYVPARVRAVTDFLSEGLGGFGRDP